MQYYISNLLLALVLVALSGCGQTGPLYMPPETIPVPPAMTEPGTAPTTAPSAPPGATESVGPPRSEAP